MSDDDLETLRRLHLDIFGRPQELRGAAATAVPSEEVEDLIVFDRDWSDPTHDRNVLIRTIRFWGEHGGWKAAVMLLLHLGKVSKRDAVSALVQAFWISVGADLPPAKMLRAALELTKAIGIKADASPLIVALTWLRIQSSPEDPSGGYRDMAMNLLSACAVVRGSMPEECADWMSENVLVEPREFERRLTEKLLAMVPADGWYFDRAELPLFSS